MIPQQASHDTGDQHRDAAHQVEETKGGAAKIDGRGVGHHRGQQALRHAHVDAPQCHTGEHHGPVVVHGQHQIRGDQNGEPPGQQRLVTHPVGQLPKRVGRRGIHDIHRHHHQWHQRDGNASLLRAQHQKGLAEPGQRNDRAHANQPPIRATQAPQVFPTYRVDPLCLGMRLGLANAKQQQCHRQQPRNDSRPEHSPEVVGPQQHQADGQEWPQKSPHRVE